MDDLKSAALSVITGLLIFIMILILSIFFSVGRIESSLMKTTMNTTCIECQCREVPDGKEVF